MGHTCRPLPGHGDVALYLGVVGDVLQLARRQLQRLEKGQAVLGARVEQLVQHLHAVPETNRQSVH